MATAASAGLWGALVRMPEASQDAWRRRCGEDVGFPRRNAALLLKWQWWDLRGTEPLGFGDSERGSIPQ